MSRRFAELKGCPERDQDPSVLVPRVLSPFRTASDRRKKKETERRRIRNCRPLSFEFRGVFRSQTPFLSSGFWKARKISKKIPLFFLPLASLPLARSNHAIRA